MPVADWYTQRLGDPHHQQQIAAREPRHPRIERAEHIGIGVDPPRERRPREIDVTGRQNEVIEKEAHLSETRQTVAGSAATRPSSRSIAAITAGSSSVGAWPTSGTVTRSPQTGRAAGRERGCPTV